MYCMKNLDADICHVATVTQQALRFCYAMLRSM